MDLPDFWTVESEGLKSDFCYCQQSSLTHQEVVEEELIRSSAHKVGKQWEIAYPWCKDQSLLPDNKIQAEKVLSSTEKRLARNPEHAEAYGKQIKEMEEKNCHKSDAAAYGEWGDPSWQTAKASRSYPGGCG